MKCPRKFKPPEFLKESLIAIADEGISNAIKYSGIITNPEITIKVNVETKNNWVNLNIIDNGYGTEKIVEGYGIKKIRRVLSELKIAGLNSSLEMITSPSNGFALQIRIDLENFSQAIL